MKQNEKLLIMKIIIGDNENEINARNITIVIADTEFKITVNYYSELVVNKCEFGEGETALTIKPSVSNEIRLS